MGARLPRVNYAAALLLSLVLASVATTTSTSLGATAALRAGVFYLRLHAEGVHMTRRISLVR